MRKIAIIALIMTLVGTLAGMAQTAEELEWLQQAELGEYQPAVEDWGAIYDAAREEGKVVIYSLSSRIYDAIESFKSVYPGIEVEAYDLVDSEQVEKLTREQGAGIYDVDILFFAGATIPELELLPQGYIYNYVPHQLFDGKVTADLIPEDLREPLLVHSLESKVVFYNTENYPDAPPLTTLWGLTRPEWNGRVQMKDPMLTEENMNFLQTLVQHADEMAAAYEIEFGEPITLSAGVENAGYEFIKRLVENDIVLTSSDGDAAKAVGAAGQDAAPVTLSVASSKLRYNNTKGTVLAIAWDLEPMAAITKQNMLAIANLAPHPNAAKLLIRYMLGDSFGGGGFIPFNVPGGWSARSDVPSAAPGVTLDSLVNNTWFLDATWIYDNGLMVQDFWLSL
jgi:iron(III) transport system substrate-binding protein